LYEENLIAMPCSDNVIKLTNEFKFLGRKSTELSGFSYNGVHFSQENLTLFAGLCAVSSREEVEKTMQVLQQNQQTCTRMGAYKPRTSPYSFQGLGKECLPYVFDLAGKYQIKVISMEVTHERHIEEIHQTLERLGHPTGVMLQIGTRNAQNFELLRAVGSQNEFPILFKRGYGISLSESLHAAEYLASSGNQKIIFCLRGVKTLFANPHRNMVDFAHVPVIKRITTMPVGIDPSHSAGTLAQCPHHMSDIYHASAQGIISGANLVLVDFHPHPPHAAVDGRQAISIKNLPWFIEDVHIARQAFEKRVALAKKYNKQNDTNKILTTQTTD